MAQEVHKELDNLLGSNVLVGVKSAIQTKTSVLGRDRESRDGRDLRPITRRDKNGGFPFWSPRAGNGRHQQEAALVKEAQMGSKFCGFFLCVATRGVSSSGSPFRCAPGLVCRVSGNSNPRHA